MRERKRERERESERERERERKREREREREREVNDIIISQADTVLPPSCGVSTMSALTWVG